MTRTNLIKLFLFGCILLNSTLVISDDLLSSGGFNYNIKSVPEWVTQSTLPVPKKIQTQGSQYLLSDEQLNVTNGQFESYSRIAQKVTTEQALEQASKLSILFNPEFQTFTLHKILVHRGNDVLDLTRTSKIELFQREEQVNNNIYDGKVTVFIVIPDIRVGDIVEYASTTHGKNPVFGDSNFATFSLGWSVALQNSFMRLITDHDRPLEFKVHKIAGEPIVSTNSNTIEYTWAQEDIAAIINEQSYPAGFNPYPYVEFTEFGNWQAVIDWALTHYQAQPSDSELLSGFVEQLKAETDSKFEYIEAAIKFVQNDVRYFGIETGQNSHIPSKPTEVFERRYGDCKDKTMLLNYLLAQIDIEASPALVATRSRGTIADNLPSPGHFDHVITYFNFNQQDYWIDGTRTFQFGQLENIGVSNFEQALVINPKQHALKPLKIRNKHRSQLHVKETFAATGEYEAPVNLNVTITFFSHEAEYVRGALAAQTVEEFTKHYLDFYSKHFPQVKALKDIEIKDDHVLNTVELSGEFVISEFWQIANNRVTTPLYGEFLSSYAQLPSTIQRKFPLGLYHPIDVSQQVNIIFPESIDWNFEQNPMYIENSAVSYSRAINFDQKRLTVDHKYVTKSDKISAEDVPTYVKDVKKIRDALYLTVFNGKNASQSIRSIIRNLLNRKSAEQQAEPKTD